MDMREALVGLRRDDTEWQRGQQALARALAAWRAEPVVAPVIAAMKRFGEGAPLHDCKALAVLFEDGGVRAAAFAESLVAAGIAALDGHPLGQLPLSHGPRDALPMLVLARSGTAALSLAACDGPAFAAFGPPRTVRFRPVECWGRVLSGGGTLEHVRRGAQGAAPDACRIGTGTGEVHHCFGPEEAIEVVAVDGGMAFLALERELDGAGVVHEVSREDGALVHRASGRPEDSRDELVAALLGAMGRLDSVPQLARLALGAGGDAMRWQALREAIALDALVGVELLGQVAANPEDPLQSEAGALLAALLGTRPDLASAVRWPV